MMDMNNSTRLSVNINKVATLRNARGGNLPDLLQVAQDCERFGAEGITVHPRPDERHIRYQDVLDLKPIVKTEFNIEGFPQQDFINLVLQVKPEQCTLVPDSPEVLTSDHGWDIKSNAALLKPIIATLQKAGIRVSLFIDPDPEQVALAATIGADRVELYTGDYAKNFEHQPFEALITPYVACGISAQQNGIGLNAGHDLNLSNLAAFKQHIPGLLEVSIGHALICDALYLGLENTINLYKRALI